MISPEIIKYSHFRAHKANGGRQWKPKAVKELKDSTMNLAAIDWKLKVNKDYSLNAAWRQEKVAFVEDYIGREATR